MSTSTEFTLPGRRNKPIFAFVKAAVAWSYLASLACNPRNLEHCTYALWNLYLMDLTSDTEHLLVNPQHVLYYNPEDSENGNSDEAIDDHDAANTTIESIAHTLPDNSAKSIIPDFAIIHIKFRFRNPVARRTWSSIKIQHAGVPLLAEGKRSGTRSSIKMVDLLQSTEIEIGRAQSDLLIQAAYLFRMHPGQRSVILLAFSGRYWTCRLIERKDVIHLAGMAVHSNFEPDEDDDEVKDDDDDECDDDQKTDADVELTDDESSEGPDAIDRVPKPNSQTEDGATPGKQKKSPADFLAPVMDEANLALPTTEWTNLLRIETPASNQRFYLIHARLQDVMQDNSGHMG